MEIDILFLRVLLAFFVGGDGSRIVVLSRLWRRSYKGLGVEHNLLNSVGILNITKLNSNFN